MWNLFETHLSYLRPVGYQYLSLNLDVHVLSLRKHVDYKTLFEMDNSYSSLEMELLGILKMTLFYLSPLPPIVQK